MYAPYVVEGSAIVTLIMTAYTRGFVPGVILIVPASDPRVCGGSRELVEALDA